ncbi:MAG: class I SAM-dependent methyltransferase [Bacteroidia bacterium]|nr:class I SAM-dependent methyltransferase [Bacteroidia bacterium]
MNILTPKEWQDYQLIDTGNGEKLERFGNYVLRRPEPQAVWRKSMTEQDWVKLTHARFTQEGSHSGKWEKSKDMMEQWKIQYRYKKMHLTFRLGMTAFKHVGIFPEQAANWNYIYDTCGKLTQPKVLNLFAYTGGASLAARAAGAEVIHCDSIKQVIHWANGNMELSKLDNIKWLLEDAFTFVKREAKRGRTYQGIILDPPAYGHGPKGEKWKLEDMIDELTAAVASILEPQKSFLIFNSYSLGFSPLVLENLILTHFQSHNPQIESGELYFPEQSGRKLPLGIFGRFANL